MSQNQSTVPAPAKYFVFYRKDYSDEYDWMTGEEVRKLVRSLVNEGWDPNSIFPGEREAQIYQIVEGIDAFDQFTSEQTLKELGCYDD